MIKAIIVDSSKPDREILNDHIAKHCKDIVVVAQAENVNGAVACIFECRPHIVFLATELSNGSCYDVLQHIQHMNVKIILTDSSDNHTTKAVRCGANVYLLKLHNMSGLMSAVKGVSDELIVAGPASLRRIEDEVVPVFHESGFVVLKMKNIIKLEADTYCTKFFLDDDNKIISTKNLGFYNFLLLYHYFIKVSKSGFVNKLHVLAYNNKEQAIKLTLNLIASLSNDYKQPFMDYYRSLLK